MLSRKLAKNICNCNKHISQMDITIAADKTSAKNVKWQKECRKYFANLKYS